MRPDYQRNIMQQCQPVASWPTFHNPFDPTRGQFDIVEARSADQCVVVKLQRVRTDIDPVTVPQGRWLINPPSVYVCAIGAPQIGEYNVLSLERNIGVPPGDVRMVKQ